MQHWKKMIAPIVITVLAVAGFLLWLLSFALSPEIPVFIKIIAGLIPAALAGVAIFVLIERIGEIRSGEEDDLGKY
jgi:riboflavin transporter FmnP